jgi:hypothetical protein
MYISKDRPLTNGEVALNAINAIANTVLIISFLYYVFGRRA